MKALVTGGTRGIGEASARALRDAGYEVTVTGTAKKGHAPAGCGYLACDFSKLVEVQKMARMLADGGFAILVNNAGINTIGLLERYDLKEFLRIQQVNVTAPFLFCRA